MRILLRSGKAPETVLGPEASLARNKSGVFGANVGNFLFSHAVHELLSRPGVEVVPDSMSLEQPGISDAHIASINEEFDALVLPLANAFRPSFLPWLDRLTRVVSKAEIPVSVVGVGAQLPYSGDFSVRNDKLDASVKAFCNAVLERSPSIGVRGEITASYLKALGYGDSEVEIIGCPSMFVHGPHHTVERSHTQLTAESAVALNVTPSVPGMGGFLSRALAEYKNSEIVLQEFRELELLLWGTPVPGYPADLPGRLEHPAYQQGALRFFLDTRTWFSYMRDHEFATGNRIHGTIAALSAGTPGVLLSHDSRTRELAEYHGIPYVSAVDADIDTLRISDLWDRCDLTTLNELAPKNFERFSHFLHNHNLSHIYDEGQANSEYASLLDSTVYPEPVRPLSGNNTQQLASRLQWLRQGIPGDQERSYGAYRLPFAPETHQVRSNRELIREQKKQLDTLANRSTRFERENRLLEQRLRAAEALLAEHQSHFNYIRRPIGEKLKRAIAARAGRFFQGGEHRTHEG